MTTVSGLITKRMGTFAKVGDVLELGRYELRVEQTYRRQVERADPVAAQRLKDLLC